MRRTGAIALLLACLTGCSYSLPLGGVGRGRGAPVGAGHFEIGTSFGVAPEAAGTLPVLLDEYGEEVNPIPPGGSAATHAGAFDVLGASYGFTDWLDVGLSFSRGLHALARLGHGEHWSVSLSPSVFRYSASSGGDETLGRREGAITNLNLTLLGSVVGLVTEQRRVELYAGVAANHYRAWIRSDGREVDHAATAPSVLAGLRTHRYGTDRSDAGTWRRPAMAVGFELLGAWLTERGRGRSFEPGLRIYLSIGAESRAPER